jgi:hypothetical protein
VIPTNESVEGQPSQAMTVPMTVPVATRPTSPSATAAIQLRMAAAAPPSPMFTATRPMSALDLFRTPYSVSGESGSPGVEQLRASEGGPSLLWPRSPTADGQPVAAVLGRTGGTGIPLFANIMPDRQVRSILAEYGGHWTRVGVISRAGGDQVGSVWRNDDGSVFLPFDPDEVQLALLSEQYHGVLRGPGTRDWRRLAMRRYYGVRGFMPKPMQIWLRRRYAHVQARAVFPRWPVETGLHDFLDLIHSILGSIAGEPVPGIACWPGASSWALVLTHDVETTKGVAALDPVLALERSLGLRSSWNFVPRRYEVSMDRIESLTASGFEVGVHGLYHDGRDLEPVMLRARLPAMRDAAERWTAIGFRSPATHRGWDCMPTLGFDYDSSYPDTDPFEPQAGGCCTWLPFFNRDIVELPMTMPQDHTLFVILRRTDEDAWVQKAEFLRSRGGMALLDTHPDYLTDRIIFDSYRRFLERFADDPSAWKALPREASAWWRRRAGSRLERVGNEWTVTGPAAQEATVEFRSTDADWVTALEPEKCT